MTKARFIKEVVRRYGKYWGAIFLGMVVLYGIEKVVIADYKRKKEQRKMPGISAGITYHILNDKNEVIYTDTLNYI